MNPKFKRELRRVKKQVISLVMTTYEPWMRWDKRRHPSKYLTLHTGAVQQPAKLAIYLVYEPLGLAASTLMTLRHFTANGYGVFLVSNARLTTEDIEKAYPHCWKLMERTNFGYDFGGYQDAVLHMSAAGLAPEHMVILNDSIWFPLHENCNLLTRMEQSDAAFVGALGLGNTVKKYTGRKKPQFMGSFFWHFKQEALVSKAFADFWNDYKATSSKLGTVRRGEHRFTPHLVDAGLSAEAMYSRKQFDSWLTELQGEALKSALKDLCTSSKLLSRRQQTLLDQTHLTDDWEKQARELAAAITESQNIMATAPLFMVRDAGVIPPFLTACIGRD